MTKRNELLILAAYLLIILIFWDSVLIFPFKIISVVFHEIGHMISGFITGGKNISFVINPNLSGQTTIIEGNRFITAVSGYLSSLLFGFYFYELSHNIRLLKRSNYIISFFVLFLAANFSKGDFTVIASLLTIIILIFPLFIKKDYIQKLTIKFISVSILSYVLADIVQDNLVNNYLVSDSEVLERITGISASFWGIFWIICFATVLLIIIKRNFIKRLS